MNTIEIILKDTSGQKTLTHNNLLNMQINTPNTSLAGNTYFDGIRFSDKILIEMAIGIGYAYTFLNILRIYKFNNGKLELLVSFQFHNQIFSDEFVKTKATESLIDLLSKDAIAKGIQVEEEWLRKFVENLVVATNRNQLDNIRELQFNNLLKSIA